MPRAALVAAALAILVWCPTGAADDSRPEPRVAWFASWADARAEAARTGRPILVIAATPHCHYVPGVW